MTTHDATHDNLPIMNGLVWTKLPECAGIYFCDEKGDRIAVKDFRYAEEKGEATAVLVHDKGEISVRFAETELRIVSAKPFAVEYKFVEMLKEEKLQVKDSKTAIFQKRGYEYALRLKRGNIRGNMVHSEEGEISVTF